MGESRARPFEGNWFAWRRRANAVFVYRTAGKPFYRLLC